MKSNYKKFKEESSVSTTVYMSPEDTGDEEINVGTEGVVFAEPKDEEELVGVIIEGTIYYLPQDVLELTSREV